MAEYNSDFWMTIGAAAPVVGLAQTVFLERFLSTWLRAGDLKKAFFRHKPRAHKRQARALWRLAIVLPVVLSCIGITLCTAALIAAFLSIGSQNDHGSKAIYGVLVAVAMFLVVIQSMLGVLSQPMDTHLQELKELEAAENSGS